MELGRGKEAAKAFDRILQLSPLNTITDYNKHGGRVGDGGRPAVKDWTDDDTEPRNEMCLFRSSTGP